LETLNLPLFPVGEEQGEFLVFLPGVQTEELEELAYEVDDEEDKFHIHCIYGEEDGQPVGNTYVLEVNDVHRDQLQRLEKLAVLNPSDMEPEELTEDPEAQEELQSLFDYLIDLEENQLTEEPAS